MQVKTITITGENVIIASGEFADLCEAAAKAEKLWKVVEAARNVLAWDWSDNVEDCVKDIETLQAAVDSLSIPNERSYGERELTFEEAAHE